MKNPLHNGYAPVGRCIYCSNPGPYRKEHIIPLSLNGNVTLPEASCAACEKITSAFERVAARDSFKPFRKAFGFQSRRTRQDTGDLTLSLIHPDGQMTRGPAPINDHPLMLCLPDMQAPPSITVGMPARDAPIGMWTHVANPDAVKRLPEGTRVGGTPVHLLSVLRMLAKIAHAYAYAEKGFEEFRPILPDFIRGVGQTPPGYFIGHIGATPPAEPGVLHRMSLEKLSGIAGDVLLIANLRLFAQFGAPQYHIVVGII